MLKNTEFHGIFSSLVIGLWCLVVIANTGLEHALIDSADRAYPIVRNIFERRSGRNTMFRITFFRVIHIATRITEILLHKKRSFQRMYLET